MTLPTQIALVAEGVNIDLSILMRVASVLSKQVHNDFNPIWNLDARVSPYAKLEDVPTDAWPIIVKRNVQGAAGYHINRKDGQPFALVEFSDHWSLTASHECIEMIVDPYGNRLQDGMILDQAVQLGYPQREVRYLVEACDPSEGESFGYQINGFLVSDFYTPDFFKPVTTPNTRYSFTRAIDTPLKVLDGGYITWQDPVTDHWNQLCMFPDDTSAEVPHLVDLSANETFTSLLSRQSLRSAVDRVTKPHRHIEAQAASPLATAARTRSDLLSASRQARAKSLRDAIDEIT